MSRQPSLTDFLAAARRQSPAAFNAALGDLTNAGLGVPDSIAASVLLGAESPAERTRLAQSIGDTNARELQLRQQLLGLGRRSSGSSTPRFNPLQVESGGDIVFEGGGQQFESLGGGPVVETTGQARPSFASLFDQQGPSAAEAQELANRQAIEAELLTEQRARALGTIAGRTGADAQAARQILGIPATPGFEDLISPEQDQVMRARIAEYERHKAQVDKWASQPTADQANIDNLQQQLDQRFPEFAGGARPQTREDQLQQIRLQEEAEFVKGLDDFSASIGLTSRIPIRRNKDGELEPIVSLESIVAAQNQRASREQSTARQNATAKFQGQMKVLRAKAPRHPGAGAFPRQLDDFNRSNAAHVIEVQQAFDEYTAELEGQSPPAPTAAPPPAPGPASRFEPQGALQDVPVDSDDELASGLAERRWAPGTVLSMGGFRAVVDPSGLTLSPLDGAQ